MVGGELKGGFEVGWGGDKRRGGRDGGGGGGCGLGRRRFGREGGLFENKSTQKGKYQYREVKRERSKNDKGKARFTRSLVRDAFSSKLTFQLPPPPQPARNDQPTSNHPILILLPFLLIRRSHIEHIQEFHHSFLADGPEGGFVGGRRSERRGGRRLERVLEEVLLTDREGLEVVGC